MFCIIIGKIADVKRLEGDFPINTTKNYDGGIVRNEEDDNRRSRYLSEEHFHSEHLL
jgi:hypothetical protein